ncbi:CvpA family protein [Flavobacterium pallidum]|uniref:Colicin V production protein n=1 Tax=Flavobacterium pallidum TaxID=2172098 RepID=A0A2S1SEW6_9FLAO|nr:CvpA family protein [Flavobacterium pallidum]AWI24940.1 colicin V production protein [Flavobacterium pallidum]
MHKTTYLAALIGDMVLLDLVFAGILIFGILSGLWDGFFVELASLISLFAGIFLAFKCSFILKDALLGHVSWDPQTVQAVAFLLTFTIVVVGIAVLGKVLTAFANFTALGLFNKIGGGVLGFVKTLLILGVVLVIFEKFNTGERFVEKATLEKAVLYPKILKTATWIYPSLESWVSEVVEAV